MSKIGRTKFLRLKGKTLIVQEFQGKTVISQEFQTSKTKKKLKKRKTVFQYTVCGLSCDKLVRGSVGTLRVRLVTDFVFKCLFLPTFFF